MEVSEDNLVCQLCLESNLTEVIVATHCAKCNKIFCIHTASKLDPMYCNLCLADVSITIEHPPEVHPSATVINFTGNSWLFMSRRVKALTDTELALAIEYHRGMITQMLAERDQRKLEQFKKQFNGAKFTAAATNLPANVIVTNAPPKKEKKKKDGTLEAMKILQDLMKQGLSIEDLKLITSMKK